MAVITKTLSFLGLIVLTLTFAETRAEVFTVRSISVSVGENLNIDLGRGRDFRFNVGVRVDKERTDKNLAGSNLWKLSAWFGPSEDGSGPVTQFVDQVLSDSQSGTAYKKSARLNLNRVEYSLAEVSGVCADLQYFCVRFGTDAPSLRNGGELTVTGFPDETVLTKCVPVPSCTENPNICNEDGIIYSVGDVWNPDSCTNCVCVAGGSADCTTETCPLTLCSPEYFITAPGTCCPTCPTSCVHEGVLYDINATWFDDVCTSCTCLESGEAECDVMECSSPDCAGGTPIYRPGECCPVCPLPCDEGEEVYRHLQEWKPSVCITCSCFDGTTGCEVESCPGLLCDFSKQIRADDQCCTECAVDCVASDGTIVAHGESFSPDVCTTCDCYNGTFDCRVIECVPPACETEFQVTRINECCPVCANACVHKGEERPHLSGWQDDVCTTCSCYDGKTSCGIESCDSLLCPPNKHIQNEKKCCPECAQDCTLRDDTVVEHGDPWTKDVCTSCVCLNGTLDCVTEVCPYLECSIDQQVTKPYNCCAECAKGCSSDGIVYNHQSEWSPDPCLFCSCYDGEERCSAIQCESPRCDPDRRILTREGECCPFCSEGDAAYVKSVMVKIKFNGRSKLKLSKKKPKFQFTPIVVFDASISDITGINLWKISAWFSKDNLGTSEKARIEQVLDYEQSSRSLVSNERMNFGPIKLKFKTKKAKCNKLKYFCVRFDLTDNPLANGVSLFLDPTSVVQHCEQVPTCIEETDE